MAFSKTPMESVEQTKIVNLYYDWQSRSASTANKDAEAINVIWESTPSSATGEGYVEAIKREGLAVFRALVPGDEVYGMYYWDEAALIIIAGSFGTAGLRVDGSLAWATGAATFPGAGHIGFTNYQYENGTNVLLLIQGLTLYHITELGVVTAVVDPDFPPNPLSYPVFLDGYAFIANDNGDIYNSDYNNPLSWSASNIISSESYADAPVALARHGVYIVLFGTASTEFFYDAANPTGTPLAKYTASTPRIGLKGGLVAFGDSYFFIGAPVNGPSSLCVLTDLTIKVLGSLTSNRQIDNGFSSGSTDFPGHILTINGTSLYTWTPNYFVGSDPAIPIFAFDILNKKWIRLVSPITTGFSLSASTFVFRPVQGSAPYTLVVFSSPGSRDVLYKFSKDNYTDAGQNFTVQFTTSNLDYGTRRMKFGSRVLLVADQTPSSSLCSISWSDDDYQTFSTARTVDLSQTYPHLYALGSFRKRAWKVSYTDAFPMRWQQLEVDYTQGQA